MLAKVIYIIDSETKELVASISEDDVILKHGYEVIESDETEPLLIDSEDKIKVAKCGG